ASAGSAGFDCFSISYFQYLMKIWFWQEIFLAGFLECLWRILGSARTGRRVPPFCHPERSRRISNISLFSPVGQKMAASSDLILCAVETRILRYFCHSGEEEGYWRSFDFAQDDKAFF